MWEYKTGAKFYVDTRSSGGLNLDRQWKSSQTGTIARCEFSWNFHAIHSRSSSQSEKRGSGSFLIVVARSTNWRKQKEVPDQLTLQSFRSGGKFYIKLHIYIRVWWIKSTAFSKVLFNFFIFCFAWLGKDHVKQDVCMRRKSSIYNARRARIYIGA